MMDPDRSIEDRLWRIFGVADETDRVAAARKSERKFVRGRYQIGVYDERRNPTGSVISAYEALTAYGIDVLDETIEYGTALLLKEPNAVGNAIRGQREALGLSVRDVSRKSSLSEEDVGLVEEGKADGISFPNIERLAFSIGLDESQIAFNPQVTSIAGRLKTMQDEAPGLGLKSLSSTAVSVLTEAASVIRTQTELQESLKLSEQVSSFVSSDDYGNSITPGWKVGYELAHETRNQLGLGEEPIGSMRDLVETKLGIPIVQAELAEAIAGVTISIAGGRPSRGIVLNTKGHNENPLVRRATMAHELGHLLFDTDPYLDEVHVDSYRELDKNPERTRDTHVEQRANAFAISFLAPIQAVKNRVRTPICRGDAENLIREFGISVTAAKFHIYNVHYHTHEVPNLRPDSQQEWRGVEDFTVAYFPLHETPITRRGRFSGMVVRAWKQNLLSEETAARYLNCTVGELESNADTIEELYFEQ